MVDRAPIPIRSLFERQTLVPFPKIGSIFSEVVVISNETVTKLVWDNFESWTKDPNGVLAGFAILRKAQFEENYSLIGFTQETFYYDHFGFVDDFRNLPHYLYLVASFYNLPSGSYLTQIDKYPIKLPKGVYLLFNDKDDFYNEASLKIGNNVIKVPAPVFLILIVNTEAEVSFDADTSVNLLCIPIGGVSEVTHPMSYDTTDENRLGTHLRRILQEEVRRVKEIYYPNFGEEIIVLTKKRAGEKCPRCFRDGFVLDDKCPVCYGTGFVGGYNAYRTYGQFNFPQERFSIGYQERGEWFGNRIFELLTPPELVLRPLDVVVRMDGTRFKVGAIDYSRIARTLIHQRASITLLDRNDAAYKIPVSFAQSVRELFENNLQTNPLSEIYEIVSNITRVIGGLQYDQTQLKYMVV
jgi:hypothetical protein